MTLSQPAFDTLKNQIICTDALTLLRGLPSDSIDMVMTSPPYDDLRTYKGFTFDYKPIAVELYRVMKPGGVVVWVVGDQTKNGCESLTSFKQAIYFVEVAGFNLHDTMIYYHPTVTFPHPKIYHQQHEYMFILSKSKINIFNGQVTKNLSAGKRRGIDTQREQSGALSFRNKGNTPEYGLFGNVWEFATGYMKTTTDKDAYEHPAIFPEALAERHILTWSNPGDLVLDPFMGSGTTAKMARANGRHYLGCDVSQEYVELARRRLAKPYTPPLFLDVNEAAV